MKTGKIVISQIKEMEKYKKNVKEKNFTRAKLFAQQQLSLINRLLGVCRGCIALLGDRYCPHSLTPTIAASLVKQQERTAPTTGTDCEKG